MKITEYDYLSKVFLFLQQKLEIQKGCWTFGLQASKTHVLMWRLFMSSTMRAAIYIGVGYEESLETSKL